MTNVECGVTNDCAVRNEELQKKRIAFDGKQFVFSYSLSRKVRQLYIYYFAPLILIGN